MKNDITIRDAKNQGLPANWRSKDLWAKVLTGKRAGKYAAVQDARDGKLQLWFLHNGDDSRWVNPANVIFLIARIKIS